jgi:hypothetical protein
MKNWKTTSAGILAILSALIGLIFAIVNKQLTPEIIMGCAAGILTGAGLIFAKDNNVTGGTVSNGLKLTKFIIIAVLLTGIGLTATAQSKFKGFFKPVQDDIFEVPRSMGAMTVNPAQPGTWLFRPTVSITAMQLTLQKTVIVNSFQSLGTGLSYNHYINQNGLPYSDYGFNLLILYNYDLGGSTPVNISFASTVTAFEIVNVGIGYSPQLKCAFILTGISYSFNK